MDLWTRQQQLAHGEARAHARYGRTGETATFGPLVAVFAGPDLPLNTAWHDGSRRPSAGEWAAFEAFCARHGQTPTVHVLSAFAPELLPEVTARGYTLSTVLHAYAHDLHDLPAPPLVPVHEVADAARWATLSAQGFGPGSGPIMATVAQAPGTALFVAELDGQGAGSAALSLVAGVAAFHGASTLPERRGQGVQASLLSARLRAARRLGAEWASVFVTPGTGSERNVARAGFVLVGARLTWSLQTSAVSRP